MSELPTFDDVAALPAWFDEQVSPQQIDENGHMNISHYFSFGSWAVWKATEAAGVDEAYIRDRAMSLFTVEHHIRYLAEMRLGDRFTVHERMLARSNKATHAMAFVLDRQRSRLAATLEIVYVHVSMSDRVAVDIPDDIAASLDERIAASEALPWAAPVCGVMGVRRR